MVIAHQTFGDMLRWNPHFHAGCIAEQQSVRIATRPIVLEGGFDDEGTFFFVPFSGLHSMVEVFRRRVITLLVDRELLNEDFARNLLSWKHSGFSIDNSVRILDEFAKASLAEYIARPPRMHARAVSGANDQRISLKKIRYEPFKGKVLFHTTYSEYFRQNVHMFDALDFLAELTPDAWASNTTTKERYDQPSISRRGDYSSSGAMACMPPGRKDGGTRCLGSPSEHRRDGRPPIDTATPRAPLATSRCRMETKKSTRMHASVPGSSDSRSEIANPKGPASCKGLRGRSDGMPQVWRGDEVSGSFLGYACGTTLM